MENDRAVTAVAGLRLLYGEDAPGVGGFGQGLAQDAFAALALAGDDQQAAAPGRCVISAPPLDVG